VHCTVVYLLFYSDEVAVKRVFAECRHGHTSCVYTDYGAILWCNVLLCCCSTLLLRLWQRVLRWCCSDKPWNYQRYNTDRPYEEICIEWLYRSYSYNARGSRLYLDWCKRHPHITRSRAFILLVKRLLSSSVSKRAYILIIIAISWRHICLAETAASSIVVSISS